MLKISTDKKSLIFLQFLTQAIFILFPKVTPWFTLTNPLNELIVCFYQISSQTIRWGAFCWATLSAYFLLGYRKNLFRRVFEVVMASQSRPKTTNGAHFQSVYFVGDGICTLFDVVLQTIFLTEMFSESFFMITMAVRLTLISAPTAPTDESQN